VGDKHHRLLATNALSHGSQGLVPEVGIAHAQHFVNQQDIDMRQQPAGEPQPGTHAGGIGFHRLIEGIPQLGEFADGLKTGQGVTLADAL
tara:strand:- start:1272 stop:1541 length:270 start_codon:yes stop_codon:yes gene_type:complete